MPDVVSNDELNALAAEYVLGTLDYEERKGASALLEVDATFRGIVRIWERRFGELHLMVELVEPDQQLWMARIRPKVPGIEQVPPAIPSHADMPVPAASAIPSPADIPAPAAPAIPSHAEIPAPVAPAIPSPADIPAPADTEITPAAGTVEATPPAASETPPAEPKETRPPSRRNRAQACGACCAVAGGGRRAGAAGEFGAARQRARQRSSCRRMVCRRGRPRKFRADLCRRHR